MDSIVPKERPDITRAEAKVYVQRAGQDVVDVFILGRRGYYRDSMGKPGVNDINIYDDAIAIVTPKECWTFNANTDPSRDAATLKPGTYWYKLGIHGLSKPKEQQYEALVQAGDVILSRPDTSELRDGYHPVLGFHMGGGFFKGAFGVNHHKGGNTTTGSLACQTIHPSQWGDYIEKVKSTLKLYGLEKIPYILTEREAA